MSKHANLETEFEAIISHCFGLIIVVALQYVAVQVVDWLQHFFVFNCKTAALYLII